MRCGIPNLPIMANPLRHAEPPPSCRTPSVMPNGVRHLAGWASPWFQRVGFHQNHRHGLELTLDTLAFSLRVSGALGEATDPRATHAWPLRNVEPCPLFLAMSSRT